MYLKLQFGGFCFILTAVLNVVMGVRNRRCVRERERDTHT